MHRRTMPAQQAIRPKGDRRRTNRALVARWKQAAAYRKITFFWRLRESSHSLKPRTHLAAQRHPYTRQNAGRCHQRLRRQGYLRCNQKTTRRRRKFSPRGQYKKRSETEPPNQWEEHTSELQSLMRTP